MNQPLGHNNRVLYSSPNDESELVGGDNFGHQLPEPIHRNLTQHLIDSVTQGYEPKLVDILRICDFGN